ncbi:hypothetical protein [Methylovulum psychrotolerans]|uniref:Uncharacterized protein n=1 Tax=Methylovulum psychrotolerans TaxID=1704499 RepID=A0A2S5CQF6_9GAMM|nr:hypothetical protein [Methylovulum psychrotolerans]POZ52982.1 hypothetical protein AADEFJLK_01598 [Methylovulum psychrotolerans]
MGYDGKGKLAAAIAGLYGLSPKSQAQIAAHIKQAKAALNIISKAKVLPDDERLAIYRWHVERRNAATAMQTDIMGEPLDDMPLTQAEPLADVVGVQVLALVEAADSEAIPEPEADTFAPAIEATGAIGIMTDPGDQPELPPLAEIKTATQPVADTPAFSVSAVNGADSGVSPELLEPSPPPKSDGSESLKDPLLPEAAASEATATVGAVQPMPGQDGQPEPPPAGVVQDVKQDALPTDGGTGPDDYGQVHFALTVIYGEQAKRTTVMLEGYLVKALQRKHRLSDNTAIRVWIEQAIKADSGRFDGNAPLTKQVKRIIVESFV